MCRPRILRELMEHCRRISLYKLYLSHCSLFTKLPKLRYCNPIKQTQVYIVRAQHVL